MKRKQRQRWIAMLMAVVMLSGTIGSAGLAQTPETERGTVQESGAVQEKERQLDPSLLPERVKAWTGEYETVTTQEEADALRTQDESKNLLIAAKECPFPNFLLNFARISI